ncbi:hypothetical protein NC652_012568 [Populus alba x Populus x berolinensis]|uniref:Uncharacterized protein n=1 Tax=Populus alba x Populus x berolinensis TaxID=444605 RepID=A0AAD6QSQ1_9ROSI|nr:hypothetical protein NC652_012568 [Populus alba x Populus x berolinensis]KAJ6995758.1 hypothetical protein NC653_012580 [Populus alba x Populus x berolinensis]
MFIIFYALPQPTTKPFSSSCHFWLWGAHGKLHLSLDSLSHLPLLEGNLLFLAI